MIVLITPLLFRQKHPLNLFIYADANPVNFTDPGGLWVVPALVRLAQLARTVGSRLLPHLIPLTQHIPIATKVAKDILDQSGPSVTTGVQEVYRGIKNMALRAADDPDVCESRDMNSFALSPNEISEINEKAKMLAAEMRYLQLRREMESYHIE